MKDEAGRGLAESLAEAVNGADSDAAARVMTRLAGLDGRGWLRLSSAMSMGPPAEGCCHGDGTTWFAS
jgi:hypothetical protein